MRARIAEELAGQGFAMAYEKIKPLSKDNRRKPIPKKTDRLWQVVAVIDVDYQIELEVGTRIINLSGYTIAKQKDRHPEIKPIDYLNFQRIIDGRNKYPVKELHWVGYNKDASGAWWKASWKVTQNNKEWYLNNLHRINMYRANNEIAKLQAKKK